MPKADSSLNMLIVAAVVALGIGYYVPQTFSQKSSPNQAKAEVPKAPPKAAWAASAPGRVEPIGGEVRISAQAPGGRISDVLIGVNEKVAAGDLMVRLADEELVARVHAARAEVAVRKRDRDNETVTKAAQDRRTAEDNFANAERTLALAREELDRVLKTRRSGTANAADADKARDGAKQAVEKLEQMRTNLRRTMSADAPAQTRLEAALAAARAELSLAEAALERTRIRAPSDGTVLQVSARTGETAVPSPESALVVVGDVTSLRVRAEFEERDIGKIRIGQTAIVRSDAFAGQDFEGKVSSLAQALAPSKLGQRGPRRPTDVDVLEVIIDLTGRPPLLPGMRIDVFLKADAPGQPAAAAGLSGAVTKAN
jgi:HlyD family secretion protein